MTVGLGLNACAAWSADTLGPILGVVAHLPSAQTLLIDVKDATDVRLLNRQVSVRLRGLTPASRSGKAQRDRMQLDALLLGQHVTLAQCTRAGKDLLCDAQVSRNREADIRHDVGDLLVANGLATRQRR
ncbi:MAG: hypothetical protein K2W33_05680 [Burkholderiales bacterium]|nr:hypothetical protein [Burkholderiales bacterium]